MKKLLSTLLLIVMLCQVLPFDAMATVGKVLTDDELARAYALTGLGQHDGLYHNGMMPNASMSGMQLARWLESQLDNQVHTIDDVLARARYQLDVLKERYPAVYRVFVQSAFYDHTAAWWELLTEYGVDSAAVEDFSDEMNAMLTEIRSLLDAIGASTGEGDIGQWISKLFLQYHSNEDGLVILPSNKFVTNKYDEVHLYIEVDPRQQGYRNFHTVYRGSRLDQRWL